MKRGKKTLTGESERTRRLKRARLLMGKTRLDVANKLRVSLSAVSMWESGARDPAPPKYAKYAEELGITVVELLEILGRK